MFVPSVTITVYGGFPPVTTIFKFVEDPMQIVSLALLTLKTEAVIGGTSPPTFKGLALDAVTVKQEAQIVAVDALP